MQAEPPPVGLIGELSDRPRAWLPLTPRAILLGVMKQKKSEVQQVDTTLSVVVRTGARDSWQGARQPDAGGLNSRSARDRRSLALTWPAGALPIAAYVPSGGTKLSSQLPLARQSRLAGGQLLASRRGSKDGAACRRAFSHGMTSGPNPPASVAFHRLASRSPNFAAIPTCASLPSAS